MPATIPRDNNNKGMMAEVNIIPLVDVMVVLLIVFMVTAPLLQQGLPVHLPEASSPALKQTKKDVVLTIQDDGQIFLGDDKQPIPIDEIEGRLSSIFTNRQQKDLFLKADTNLRYGIVVKVMALAKKAGVDRIGMITKPEVDLSGNKKSQT